MCAALIVNSVYFDIKFLCASNGLLCAIMALSCEKCELVRTLLKYNVMDNSKNVPAVE